MAERHLSDGPRKPHESRVELELRVRLPADIEDDVNVKGAWLRKWVLQTDGVVEDLKHSHDWRCEFCGAYCIFPYTRRGI